MKSADAGLAELEFRARAGDADALYRLSIQYSRLGRAAEAAALLSQSASAGHPGALYSKASMMLLGRPTPAQAATAYTLFAEAATRGALGARLKQAVLHAFGLGAAQGWSFAVEALLDAYGAGHPPAWREAGMLLCLTGDARGLGLLATAAAHGDPIARRLFPSASEDRGRALAARELRGPLLEAIRPAQTARDVVRPGSPEIIRLTSLFSGLSCAYVMAAADSLLTRSAVVDPAQRSSVEAAFRTSDGAAFGLADVDLVLFALHARAAAAAGATQDETEFLGVLRYRPGQEYKPHHDYLPSDVADYSEVRRAGQRRRTLLVSLNEGYGGGETSFPKLGCAFKGKAGDALLFENADADGRPMPDSLHSGEPVTVGEKWMLTLWSRTSRFWYW